MAHHSQTFTTKRLFSNLYSIRLKFQWSEAFERLRSIPVEIQIAIFCLDILNLVKSAPSPLQTPSKAKRVEPCNLHRKIPLHRYIICVFQVLAFLISDCWPHSRPLNDFKLLVIPSLFEKKYRVNAKRQVQFSKRASIQNFHIRANLT